MAIAHPSLQNGISDQKKNALTANMRPIFVLALIFGIKEITM